MLKKIVLTLCLLSALLIPAQGGNIPKTEITAFLSECTRYEGVEVVQLGGLKTRALRGIIRLATIDDPDARELLKTISGIKRISVMDYEDCTPAIRSRISTKLDRLLRDADLLLETKDGDERMQIYGVVDERGAVRDFVIHTPSDCALICLFGTIPLDKIAQIAAQND